MAQYLGAESWRVSLGSSSPFVVDPSKAPPTTLADRCVCEAFGEPGAIERVLVTDIETGATFEWAVSTDRVTMTLASHEKAKNVARLWRDGLDGVGIARLQTGGPVPDSGLRWQDIVDAIVAAHDRTDEWATEEAIASDLGMSERWLRKIAARTPDPLDRGPYARVLALAQDRIRRRAISSG
jgi:hypothetical protein